MIAIVAHSAAYLLFPFHDQAFAAILQSAGITDTKYTSSFSWPKFRSIERGADADFVTESLGEPFLKTYDFVYQLRYENAIPDHWLDFDFDEHGQVVDRRIWPSDISPTDSINALSSDENVRALLGEPSSRYEPEAIDYWFYTRSPTSTHYWQCIIIVDVQTQKVLETKSEFYFD